MKKFLILLTLTMSSLSVFGQIYEIPKRTMVHPTMNCEQKFIFEQ